MWKPDKKHLAREAVARVLAMGMKGMTAVFQSCFRAEMTQLGGELGIVTEKANVKNNLEMLA